MQLPESLTADLASRLPATAERERVAQALCLHFAADHLGMEALEDRLSRVYVAQTPAQLQGLLYDLPPLDTEKMDAGDAALLAPSGWCRRAAFSWRSWAGSCARAPGSYGASSRCGRSRSWPAWK